MGVDVNTKRCIRKLFGVLELFCILSVEEVIRPYSMHV